jgi:parallel beta-helix repeat protein
MSPKGADKEDPTAPDGNDANNGTSITSPVETITAAYNKLKSNNTSGSGTIVLRGGKYRSWYSTDGGKTAGFMTGLNITFQAYQKENPWFVGTDVVAKASWESTGNNIWRQRWETPHFCKSHLNANLSFEGQEYGYRTKIPGLVPGSRVAPITSGRGNKHTPYDSTSGIAMTYLNSSTGRNESTPRICAHPDAYYINPNRPVDVDSDPQMMFANDIELPQRKTLAELSTKPDSFYYDWNNQYIYVNKDPANNTLEITRRHALTNLSNGYSFQWKGIGVKRFASSPLHGVVYAGLGGSGVAGGEIIVERSVFSENSGATLDISGPKNNSAIKFSVFARNKYAGFGSNGFAAKADPTIKNKLLIDSTIFNENNYGLHDTECGASCGVAGVKLNNMVGFTVKNSIFENTKGRNAPGLWCDIDCSNGVMVNNIMRNNTGPGIFYEISSQGIIAGNLIYFNDFANIKVLAATTKIYNNTIINKPGPNVEAVWISDDNRPAPEDPAIWPNEKWPFSVPAMQDAHARLGVGYAVRVGPNTRKVEFANNLIVSQPERGARLMNFMNSSIPKSPNTNSPDYFTVMSHNIYYRVPEQPLYGWLTNGDIRSITEFQNISKQGWEQNTIDIVGTGNPFQNRAGQDFRTKTDSQAFTQKGRLLPTDVAAALGLSSTQTYQRGAISWPQ